MRSAASRPDGAAATHRHALIVTGPTAVGKSALALAIARRAPGEIIVADSMQVYRGLDVGTAKPTAAERAAVPHHLLDIREPWEEFSAADFVHAAQRAVEEIAGRGRLPILVGGTGLYLRAFLKGRLAPAGSDPAVRARLQAEAAAGGSRRLHEALRVADPDSAARIHPNDLVRIVRALEIQTVTGRPASALRPDLWDPPRMPLAGFLVVGRERGELDRLIDERCRAMWTGGLLEETRHLLEAPRGMSGRRLQAVGYRQAHRFLTGDLPEDQALLAMQRATRAYARRQITWFRREPAARWIRVAGWDWVEPLAAEVLSTLHVPR